MIHPEYNIIFHYELGYARYRVQIRERYGATEKQKV